MPSGDRCGGTERYLDSISVEEVSTGWGSLGLNGELGYEGLPVVVQGHRYSHAVSLHPQGRALFRLGGQFSRLSCLVALNDDVRKGASDANFSVWADGRLVAAANRVVAGNLPCLIEADLRRAEVLELSVDSSRITGCHAVWLDPILSAHPSNTIRDCLGRVEIEVPTLLPWMRRCLVTVVSPGFEELLDGLLSSVEANADCENLFTAVLAVDPAQATLAIAAAHDATVIRCRARRPINSSVKSALYSAARIVPAEQFLCLDADTVVLGGLRSLFAALEVCRPGAVLACADQNRRFYCNLGEALYSTYKGSQADIERFLGGSCREHETEFVANDGLFAAGRNAMLALDSTIRSMPGAPEWVDANSLRNQFLFNLAIARMRCGVQLDDQYNLQLHAQDVDLAWRGGRVQARWRGRPVRVLHFNSHGRSKHLEWKRFLWDNNLTSTEAPVLAHPHAERPSAPRPDK
jgi:hypothetical protein